MCGTKRQSSDYARVFVCRQRAACHSRRREWGYLPFCHVNAKKSLPRGGDRDCGRRRAEQPLGEMKQLLVFPLFFLFINNRILTYVIVFHVLNWLFISMRNENPQVALSETKRNDCFLLLLCFIAHTRIRSQLWLDLKTFAAPEFAQLTPQQQL